MRWRGSNSDDPVPVVDPREQLILDEARRAVDQQKKDLEGLRSRAGATIGYGLLVLSVIGGLSLRDDSRFTALTWVGAAFFALAVILAAVVLAPRKFTFVLDVQVMDSWMDRKDDSISRMMRSTYLGIGENYDDNARKLDRLYWTYMAGVAAVLVEASVLLIDLTRR